MKAFSFVWDEDIESRLDSREVADCRNASCSTLIQLYTPLKEPDKISAMIALLRRRFPKAHITGGTTPRTLIGGGLLACDRSGVSLYFFDKTRLVSFAYECGFGDEENCALKLKEQLRGLKDIKALLFLGTAHSLDIGQFLKALKFDGHFSIFGGGLLSSDLIEPRCCIISDKTLRQGCGIAAVAFCGEDFEARIHTSRGWNAVTKEYLITEAADNVVKTINGLPALDFFKYYTGLRHRRYFARFAVERPLVIERDGNTIVRAAIIANDDKSVVVAGDIREGERFRFGYLMPENMIDNTAAIRTQIKDGGAEAILVQSCVGRQSILENNIELECGGFEDIAPVCGFSSAGEIGDRISEVQQQTNVMLITEMSEKPLAPLPGLRQVGDPEDALMGDVLLKSSLTRLAYFFNVVATELEENNRRLDKLSTTDYLTELRNRSSIEAYLASELQEAAASGEPLSVLLLDIDKFKDINDKYGHICGDDVLRSLAGILKDTVGDAAGRWGGEEFVIVLPHTVIKKAVRTAEDIRKLCERCVTDDNIGFTVSLGVYAVSCTDDVKAVIKGADRALYKAKRGGRNAVVA